MKIELTEKQYDTIRMALISARIEVSFMLSKHKKENEAIMIPGVQSSLNDINKAFEASDLDKVKVTY